MFSPGSSLSSPITVNRRSILAPSKASIPLEGSSSFSISLSLVKLETHPASVPIIPQPSISGLPSLTASSDQPMPTSEIPSGSRFPISSRPIQTKDSGDLPSADTKTTSPMSNTPKPSSTTNTRADSGSGPSPPPAGDATTRVTPQTSSEKPPTPPSTRANSQLTNNGEVSSGKPSGNSAPATSNQRTSTNIAVVHTLNKSTVFTTITSSPESTLRVASSVPVTNSINGFVSLTAPPLVTLLSTSTQANGELVTFTHLVANPGAVESTKEPSGFLENRGQIAGVFTVVGVVASALVVALVWFIRRCRRRQRRSAWFDSLRQYPPSSFTEASYREPHKTSYMRSVQTTSEGVSEPHIVSYHDAGYRSRSRHQSTDESMNQVLTGVETMTRGTIVLPRRPFSGGDPFRDPPHAPQNTPVSVSPDRERIPIPSDASLAPSSPSIYPESLPPTDDNPSPVELEPKSKLRIFPEPLLHRSLSTGQTGAPPRPPRSHLREPQKPIDFIQLTPPSSHGHSKLSTSEAQSTGTPEPFTPRTWLNARPRTAPERRIRAPHEDRW